MNATTATPPCCPLACHFCRAVAPSTGAAIDAGWIPSFWNANGEQMSPACASCTSAFLEYKPDTGDYELATLFAGVPADDPLVVVDLTLVHPAYDAVLGRLHCR